jgi:two-component system CheB/CheR fusion protein
MRRVCKRMHDVNVKQFAEYIDHLEVHPEEFAHLFDTILINVTGFFRDPPAWEVLASDVIPKIIESKKPEELIRIWSAGCATGEETYTVAMLLAEALGEEAYRQRVKLYASDVDEQALAVARQATYDSRLFENVRPELVQKYFETSGTRHTFRSDLRRAIIFGRHDLLSDSPISRLDLLICRNVLMYFNWEAQARIIGRFHFALNDNGFLFLGKAELLLSHADLFTPLDMRYRIFTKTIKTTLRDRLLILTQAVDEEHGNRIARQVRTREAAWDMGPVAQIVVDAEGTLAWCNERARTLFSLLPRDIGRPLQDLEISYRPAELRSLIEQAYAERRIIAQANVPRQIATRTQYFDIEIAPIQDNGGTVLGMSVTFTDVTRYQQLQAEVKRSKQDLETAYEELQSTNEELETTNEELQSTVEELETTNEELQSTNEELETMNEELQSANEELQTVNAELRDRTDEVNRSNVFMEGILSSFRNAVIVVDDKLRVVRWNRQAEDFWGFRSTEVIGRPLGNLSIGLPLGEVLEMVRTCLSPDGDHAPKEITLAATNRRGRRFRCQVRCTPLMGGTLNRVGAIVMMEEQETPT